MSHKPEAEPHITDVTDLVNQATRLALENVSHFTKFNPRNVRQQLLATSKLRELAFFLADTNPQLSPDEISENISQVYIDNLPLDHFDNPSRPL